jgi:hypothetical protein
MIVGFTGTQRGMTEAQKRKVHDALEFRQQLWGDIVGAVHGGCVGADADFHEICEELGIGPVEVYPSTITEKRAPVIGDVNHPPAPPLDRNRVIAQRCNLLIACPKELHEVVRSGTWATVRYAVKAKKRVLVIFPDGVERRMEVAIPFESGLTFGHRAIYGDPDHAARRNPL